MGIAKKTDGRYVVGLGVTDANDYKGSASYRDIYIQLTSSGATAKSEEYLTFLKDYGFHANASGEPIMPPSVNVWISNNGVTTAVEADDVSIDGSNYTICGIKWDGSTWDYSNAGQGSGGGGGLPSYTSADKGKVLALGEGEGSSVDIVPEQALVISGSPTDATSIDNANTEYFVDGATIHVLIKSGYVTDVDEDVSVTQIGTSIETGDIYGKSNTYQFYTESGVLKFWCNYAGTYNVHVTVSVSSVEPKWESSVKADLADLPNNFVTEFVRQLGEVLPSCTDSATHIKNGVSTTDANGEIFDILKGTYDRNCNVLLRASAAGLGTLAFTPLSTKKYMVSNDTFYSAKIYIPQFYYSSNYYDLTANLSAGDDGTFQLDLAGQKLSIIS